jgi:mycofactocin precursor
MSNTTVQAPITDTDVAERPASQTADGPVAQPAIEADMLIEEISIDGMCGVY